MRLDSPQDRSEPEDPTAKFKVDIAGGNVGAIGDNAFINYGTIIKVYGNAPPSLTSLLSTKAFEETIKARARSLVGRRFIFDAIDAWLSDPAFPSGYVVVDGEPGIGKTALLCKLIADRGYIHHLNSVALGIRTNDAFMRNVCAQLIIRFKLDQAIPEGFSKDAGFLSGLLTDAAKDPRNLPIVVAIDALDEADTDDPLLLPPSLPQGVHFLVTTRAGHPMPLVVDHSQYVHLRDDDRKNLQDARSYVLAQFRAERNVMEIRVGDWGVSVCEFVRILTQASEGNFMYLSYVLDDIRTGSISKDTIGSVNKLPGGLNNYYARVWQDMQSRDQDLFDHYQKPVICLLTTALEPVSVQTLFAWTRAVWSALFGGLGLPDPSKVSKVVHDWLEYLNVDDGGANGRRYRVYHASLRDWIRNEAQLALYHSFIGDVALAKIHGYSVP
jgi:hypothetical protein